MEQYSEEIKTKLLFLNCSSNYYYSGHEPLIMTLWNKMVDDSPWETIQNENCSHFTSPRQPVRLRNHFHNSVSCHSWSPKYLEKNRNVLVSHAVRPSRTTERDYKMDFNEERIIHLVSWIALTVLIVCSSDKHNPLVSGRWWWPWFPRKSNSYYSQWYSRGEKVGNSYFGMENIQLSLLPWLRLMPASLQEAEVPSVPLSY